MTLLEMTRDIPAFKAYCRRRIEPNSTPTMAEIYAAACKAEQASFRAFCKRKGMSSILKAEKGLRAGQYDIGNSEIAQLKKVNGEFISIYEESTEAKIIRLLAEQNRLLAILKAA